MANPVDERHSVLSGAGTAAGAALRGVFAAVGRLRTADNHGADRPISFDPFVHPIPWLANYPWRGASARATTRPRGAPAASDRVRAVLAGCAAGRSRS